MPGDKASTNKLPTSLDHGPIHQVNPIGMSRAEGQVVFGQLIFVILTYGILDNPFEPLMESLRITLCKLFYAIRIRRLTTEDYLLSVNASGDSIPSEHQRMFRLHDVIFKDLTG